MGLSLLIAYVFFCGLTLLWLQQAPPALWQLENASIEGSRSIRRTARATAKIPHPTNNVVGPQLQPQPLGADWDPQTLPCAQPYQGSCSPEALATGSRNPFSSPDPKATEQEGQVAESPRGSSALPRHNTGLISS